jgi:arsenate reductase (thioredoxin)
VKTRFGGEKATDEQTISGRSGRIPGANCPQPRGEPSCRRSPPASAANVTPSPSARDTVRCARNLGVRMARRKILFLCTGNSARSILAEMILRKLDSPRFEVASAGSHPRGTVNPFALEVLQGDYQLDTSGARSKSWEEFDGIAFDFVITLCDDARETCPVWPGQPIIAHWSMPDPAAVAGTDEEKLQAFRDTARVLHRRLDLLRNLPIEKLDGLALGKAVQGIAES